MTKTLDYYNKNAERFIESTRNVDFRIMQDLFLKYIPQDGSVLDFGCGSGRDTKYFLEQRKRVEAIDGSEELCRLASEYCGIEVKRLLFNELDEHEKYDGIWACSSILHLNKKDLYDVFLRMSKALKTRGVIYTSFKYGTFEGERNGRYFTDFTEKDFEGFINKIEILEIEKCWITGDVREGRGDERWLNLILRKK